MFPPTTLLRQPTPLRTCETPQKPPRTNKTTCTESERERGQGLNQASLGRLLSRGGQRSPGAHLEQQTCAVERGGRCCATVRGIVFGWRVVCRGLALYATVEPQIVTHYCGRNRLTGDRTTLQRVVSIVQVSEMSYLMYRKY